MRRLLALIMWAVSLGAAAQATINYPYNPDEDGNGQIAVADLQGILATYGNEFSPSEILVDGETLTSVLTQLQNSIDSLSGLTGGGGSVLDMPLGTILPIATESVPEGWMLCDGREIAIEEYQGLYDLIGTTYGAGDSAFWAQVFFPATTFNIPDLRGRTVIGANDMGGEQSDVLTIHQASAGQIGGEETHQLTEDEMPSHSHFTDHSGHLVSGYNTGQIKQYNNAGTWFTFVTSINETVGPDSLGNDIPHNNMQPYMALNYMIKAVSSSDVIGQITELIADQQEQLANLEEIVLDESAHEFALECVDMGYSPLCGALGFSQWATLEPNYLGHRYNMGWSGPDANDGYLIHDPHWRKFQIRGLPAGIGEIVVEYTNINGAQNFTGVALDFDGEGNAYIYLYAVCYSGNSECSGLAIEQGVYDFPLESALGVEHCNSSSMRNLKLHYSNGWSLVSLGLTIDIY